MDRKNVDVIFIDKECSSSVSNAIKQRRPVVLRGLDIGPCAILWKDVEYLKSKIPGNKSVTCHVSTESRLNFTRKNFAYKTMLFVDLLEKCFLLKNGPHLSQDNCIEPIFYYMRALGDNQRKDVADFFKDYPGLCSDFETPEKYWPEIMQNYFSSVLRISSNGVQLWTHYDIMDNILVQVVGRKKVVLFDPLDMQYLYLEGDKSIILDVENPDLGKFPLFSKATQYTCILEESDVLFIPALWFHNTTALTPGIGLNVFWKNLTHEMYDPKDLYGNRDLAPVQKAWQSYEKFLASLGTLPEPYKSFYALRMIEDIKKKFNLRF